MSSWKGYFYRQHACSALGCFMCSQRWRAQNLGGLIQRKSWLVATEVLQRKAVTKSDRNGIVPAWRLQKTKKLYCSGSWWGHKPFMGWSEISPCAPWMREEKAQGQEGGCDGAREGRCGEVVPVPSLHGPPQMCWPGCARPLGQGFSQTLKHRNFYLKCGNVLWGLTRILWPWFVCIFLQEMESKKKRL